MRASASSDRPTHDNPGECDRPARHDAPAEGPPLGLDPAFGEPDERRGGRADALDGPGAGRDLPDGDARLALLRLLAYPGDVVVDGLEELPGHLLRDAR